MEMHIYSQENMTDFSWAQNLVRDSDGSRTVGESEFHRAGRPEISEKSLAILLDPAVRDCEVV